MSNTNFVNINSLPDNNQQNNNRPNNNRPNNRHNNRPNNRQNNRPNNRRNRNRRKNTRSFKPDHRPPDMRVLTADGQLEKYPYEYSERDVLVINNMFTDKTIYDKLLEEIKLTGDEKDIWKLWHGDNHMIADDRRHGWKEKCPTFNMVIEKIKNYFDMDVKATRFNWYRNTDEWKPFHHDAAAIDKRKAKTQNFTVGISFGYTREAAFQHAKRKTTIAIPLVDGSVYTFGKQVNIDWMHGIPQIHPDKKSDKGRISIIAWGYNNQKKN